MKIVPDYKLRPTLNAAHTAVDLNGTKTILNPFDTIALQEAVNIKKQKPDTTITTLFIAPPCPSPLIRESLALGADQAIHITTDEIHSSLNIAKIIKKIIEDQADVDLVLMGKQAIDTDSNQTPQMLGALLNWPTVCFVSQLEIDFKNKQFKASCEWDDGLVQAESSFPAVISCDLRLNTPSPATMMAIIKAKQKCIQLICLEELSLMLTPSQKMIKLEKPEKRKNAKKIESIEELYHKIISIKDEQ